MTAAAGAGVRHGLAANWRQFSLLVAVNAFVGGMAGLERSVLPALAGDEFGISSTAAAISFIASFGLAKAVANLVAGPASERWSRRSVLIAGWLVGLPVPLVIIWAPAWGWIVAANALLGVNQGLAWSMTVNMKIDLAGPRRRGLALGLNEAAGYLSVAAAAFLAGVIADAYGLRPAPFYLGIAFAAAGLALSVLVVRDTRPHVLRESTQAASPASLTSAFADATWRRPALVGVTQAGFVNNLNDALAWGVFPIFFAAQGVSLSRIAVLAAAYPLVWGALQPAAGWLSDGIGRTPLIAGGMFAQAAAIAGVAVVDGFAAWTAAVVALGAGTAMVYPTLLAATSDAVGPAARATALGVYRFWRDAGAAAGALSAGIIADAAGLRPAIYAVAGLTALSGIVTLAPAVRVRRRQEEAPLCA